MKHSRELKCLKSHTPQSLIMKIMGIQTRVSTMMFLLLAVLVMNINVGMAVDYRVGGENGGWDQSTDLASWAASQTFRAGDNLIFQYLSNHNVVEVSEDDYDSCNPANPLRPAFSGGRSVVPLTTAGSRFFICATAGHCQSGMKLRVTTLADATPPPPSTTPSPPTSSPRRPASSPPPPKIAKALPPTKSKATASDQAPAATAPQPSGTQSPPPASSSAGRVNVVGFLAAACAGLLIVVV